jgi:hypothetical protein
MSGVLIVHALLEASGDLVDEVPTTRIYDEEAPQDATLPALSLLKISGTQRDRLAAGASRRRMQRVQVTGLFNEAEERLDIMPLVLAACSERVGTIAGFSGVSVRDGGEGPDFTDEYDRRIGSHDFLVSWNEAPTTSTERASTRRRSSASTCW